MALLSVAITGARTWLNDDAANVWTDAALIPKCQEAHRELQTKLWLVGSPAVRKVSAAQSIPATTGLTLTSAITDMLTPFKIVEYADTIETIADATEVTEVNFLPNKAQSTKLDYWCWKEEAIAFLGASAARKVVVYYRKLITVPTTTSDAIGIIFGELYISARAAAIACGSTGNKDAYEILTQVCKENFEMVVQAQRGQQSPPMRP